MVRNKSDFGSRIKKLICALIPFLLLVSGVCFEEVKADSMFPYSFSEGESSSISYGNKTFSEEQACTAEMLGIRGTAGLGRSHIQLMVQRRDESASPDFLCRKISIPTEGKSYISSDGIQFISEFSEKHIVNYLHRSDGKKRI